MLLVDILAHDMSFLASPTVMQVPALAERCGWRRGKWLAGFVGAPPHKNMVLAPEEFRSLYRELGKTHSGDALWEAIINRKLARLNEMGCFVAGTLVHTSEGLRPIEQIKVGDLVLSRPDTGEGEVSFQPVTRVFEYEDREVYWLPITEVDENLRYHKGNKEEGVAVTATPARVCTCNRL